MVGRAFRKAWDAALQLTARNKKPAKTGRRESRLTMRRYALHRVKKATGFDFFTKIGSRQYLVKHGTYYRVDKLNLSALKSAA